jgi:hypothetical protein
MLAGAALALLPECPYFTEFLPHPADVPDTEGEYLRVEWESKIVPWDTIYFQLDNFNGFPVYVAPEPLYNQLLLHRGAPLACPEKPGLLCLPLTGRALPNTRATVWNLSAGICRDTAYLPVPKQGKPIVKVDGEWGFFAPVQDSAVYFDGEVPLYISEVAPCPEDGIPEWFEITNRSVEPFLLNGISDCKKAALKTTDSIKGKASVLVTKNAADLMEFLQTDEIPIYQIPIATLKNTNDTLRLCLNGTIIDSVMWGKNVGRPIKCPAMERISPGFVPRASGSKTKIMKIAERVLERSKKDAKLRVHINSQKPLELRLIDKGGVGVLRKTIGVKELNSAWIEIPEWKKCQNGPCFIHLQGEEVDETAAFIIRP